MRKINKSPNVPPTLQTASTPTGTIGVLEAIYKAADVRQQLIADQANKCAYCECKLSLQYNDVEHYRPKSHYYWLGHSWNNLLYSCPLCNRTYKQDRFPLQDEQARVNSPGSVAGERPLIINPAEVEPSIHIRFQRHMMIGMTPEGDKTIEIFHLNDRKERPDLIDNRERLFEKYEIEMNKIRIAKSVLSASGNLSDVQLDELNELIRLTQKSLSLLTSYDNAHSGMLVAQL